MKRVKYTILFALFAIVVTLYFGKEKKINSLPQFVFYDLKNVPFDHTKLLEKRVVIIYISTDCGSCEQMLNLVKKLAKIYPEIFFTVVSSNINLSFTKSKFIEHELFESKNIKLLYDRERKFASSFKLGFAIEYPTVFYYNGITGKLERISSSKIENKIK